MIRNKRGIGTVGLILALVIGLIVLFILLSFLVPGFLDNFSIIGVFGGTTNNVEAIVNKCALLCLDRDVDFCEDSTVELRLGNGFRAQGSCAALSTVRLGVIDGVARCNKVSCTDNVDVPTCFSGASRIDCSNLFS